MRRLSKPGANGKPAATIIPPAYGLAGVNNHTWTGSWGSVTYWNAYVANLEMHGNGNFFDPRLNDKDKYRVVARKNAGTRHVTDDRITAKLAALKFYQLGLPTPKAPAQAFNASAAGDGAKVFMGKARCGECHVPPLFTEPGWNLHKPSDIGIDDFQANRSPDGRYRTTSLRALWDVKYTHKRAFYDHGRFATLADVVDHYEDVLSLKLLEQERRDLVEYLNLL